MIKFAMTQILGMLIRHYFFIYKKQITFLLKKKLLMRAFGPDISTKELYSIIDESPEVCSISEFINQLCADKYYLSLV